MYSIQSHFGVQELPGCFYNVFSSLSSRVNQIVARLFRGISSLFFCLRNGFANSSIINTNSVTAVSLHTRDIDPVITEILPQEILGIIASFSRSPQDFIALSLTCRVWKQAITSSAWKVIVTSPGFYNRDPQSLCALVARYINPQGLIPSNFGDFIAQLMKESCMQLLSSQEFSKERPFGLEGQLACYAGVNRNSQEHESDALARAKEKAAAMTLQDFGSLYRRVQETQNVALVVFWKKGLYDAAYRAFVTNGKALPLDLPPETELNANRIRSWMHKYAQDLALLQTDLRLSSAYSEFGYKCSVFATSRTCVTGKVVTVKEDGLITQWANIFEFEGPYTKELDKNFIKAKIGMPAAVLPVELRLFTGIRALDVEYNQLKHFPFWIQECVELEAINCSRNFFSKIPDAFIPCPLLRMNFSKCIFFTRFPSLLSFSALREIDLSRCFELKTDCYKSDEELERALGRRRTDPQWLVNMRNEIVYRMRLRVIWPDGTITGPEPHLL